ncbi:MAG TPA: hypothetical protein VG734_14370 [Lacunisphaera sp.]|nr:hypothetical protein [Lacunisphaera sp.]
MLPSRLHPAVLIGLAVVLFALAQVVRSQIGHTPELPPLALTPASTGASAFRADAFPAELPGRNALPAVGSWNSAAGVAGTWTSSPLATSATLLQIRVAGTLRPPGTSLVLRTAEGREIAPLETNFTSTDRWKRINFPAPAGSFQLVARDDSPTDWLAFTAPVEISRWSWLVGKLARPWVATTLTLLAGAWGLAALWSLRQALAAVTAWTAWRYVPWVVLAGYAVFLSRHIDPVAGPNDSGGYLNSAKALASGHLGPLPRPIWGPAAGETDLTPYLATTFPSYAGARMAPEYPVGLPLLFAAAGKLLGMERGVAAVILLHLVLGVIFTRRFAEVAGLDTGWSWLAAVLIGLSPVYLHQGLQPQSDVAALVWCTAAVYWAWTSREHPWRAVLAGLATGLAVFVRPSDTLVILPLAIILAGHWRQFGLWVAAGLPCALWQGWYNHTLNGSAFVSGYRNQLEHFFGAKYLALTLPAYVTLLPVVFTPLILLGLGGPFLRRIAPHTRLVLAVWAGAFLAFYAFYWCAFGEWYSMRFLLPAAPAMIVLALLVVRAATERFGLTLFQAGSFGRSLLPTCLLVGFVAGWLGSETRDRQVLYWMHYNARNAFAPRWVAEHVPANAVVFARHATNSLLYYTDLTFVRADHARAKSPAFLADIARTGRPIYALNYWWEDRVEDPTINDPPGPDRGRPLLPGDWKHVAALCDNEIHVWQWMGPAALPAR